MSLTLDAECSDGATARRRRVGICAAPLCASLLGLVLLAPTALPVIAAEAAATPEGAPSGEATSSEASGSPAAAGPPRPHSSCAGAPPCGVERFHRSNCAFEPDPFRPAYAPCAGPKILFDVSNRNLHTITARSEDPDQKGRYWAFAKLLSDDGYVLEESAAPLPEALASTPARILVIAGAFPAQGEDQALSTTETSALLAWIEAGGSLLLVFDHPDFDRVDDLLAGLGLAVGVDSWQKHFFRRANGSLDPRSTVANGRGPGEALEEIRLDRGSTFHRAVDAPAKARIQQVLIHGPGDVTRRNRSIAGHLSGAIIEYGRGRVYVSGDGGMLTSVKRGAGFDAHPANQQFVLNVVHWLDHLYD